MERGDEWWALAEKENGAAQGRMQERAGQRYWDALPNLAGLAKAKVVKRLAEIETRTNCSFGQKWIDLGNNVKMKLVLIPAGKFMMGSPKDEKGHQKEEAPQHEVIISKPFYMGIYTVTQEQYEQVMGKNPSKFKGRQTPLKRFRGTMPWRSARRCPKKLGKTVCLPTEAQWEYACRAGTKTRFAFGDDDGGLSDYAWYNKNSDSKPHATGQKRPNGWGLYDMHGNVWQWCSDWYGDNYYANSPRMNPKGQTTGCWGVVSYVAAVGVATLCIAAPPTVSGLSRTTVATSSVSG